MINNVFATALEFLPAVRTNSLLLLVINPVDPPPSKLKASLQPKYRIKSATSNSFKPLEEPSSQINIITFPSPSTPTAVLARLYWAPFVDSLAKLGAIL